MFQYQLYKQQLYCKIFINCAVINYTHNSEKMKILFSATLFSAINNVQSAKLLPANGAIIGTGRIGSFLYESNNKLGPSNFNLLIHSISLLIDN